MTATTEGFLDEMARLSAARVTEASAAVPLPAMRERARLAPVSPPLRLDRDGFDLIMELKLSSPAQGVLAADSLDVEDQVGAYASAGAAIVSVLTETARFRGSLDHLSRASTALRTRGVPAMRKDFLVDPYQLYEARAHGAGGVLLIARMLDDRQLDSMLREAHALGLFVLLETFDATDIARATLAAVNWRGAAESLLIGINSRDLQTLAVVPQRLTELVTMLPRSHPRVAESGLATGADAQRLSAAGYSAALVGTALMSAADPVALGREMIAAGRRGAAFRGRQAR